MRLQINQIPVVGPWLASWGGAVPATDRPAPQTHVIDTFDGTERRFSEDVRTSTAAAHIQAETHGFVKALLDRKLDTDAVAHLRGQYIRYLVDLQHVYASLEKALEKHQTHPMIALFRDPDLYRSVLIGQDLDVLVADGRALRPSATAVAFAKYIAEADAPTLAGIARTRFLADLFGGQALGKTVAAKFGAAQLYAYPDGMGTRRSELQRGMDDMLITVGDRKRVIDGAKRTFELTVGLFDEAISKQRSHSTLGAIGFGVIAFLGGVFVAFVGTQDRWWQRS